MFIIGFIFCLTLQHKITAKTAQILSDVQDFKHKLPMCIFLGCTIIATVGVVWHFSNQKLHSLWYAIYILGITIMEFVENIILGKSITARTTGNVWNDSDF